LLIDTNGIVLRTTRYRETSAIVNIYTDKLGLQTYIVNGLFGLKSKNKISFFQPLSLLNLVVYYRSTQNIKRIKELQWATLFSSIPFNVFKSSIALFITEVLNKSIKEEEPNEALFNFLYQKIIELDEAEYSLANYLPFFLIDLSSYLGFKPMQNKTSQKSYFNLLQGQFVAGEIINKNQLNEYGSQLMLNLLNSASNQKENLKLSREQRSDLLKVLVRYYQCHIENFGKIKSLPILEQIFNDLNKN